jgi:hypothetical protein
MLPKKTAKPQVTCGWRIMTTMVMSQYVIIQQLMRILTTRQKKNAKLQGIFGWKVMMTTKNQIMAQEAT